MYATTSLPRIRARLRAKQVEELDKGSRYGALAYARVLDQLESYSISTDSTERLSAARLRELGVRGIGERIGEVIDSGDRGSRGIMRKIESFGAAVDALMVLPGMGPSRAAALVRERGILSLEDLEDSAAALPLTAQQRRALPFARDLRERPWIPRAEVLAHGELASSVLKPQTDGELILAGSYRRGQPASRDVDMVVVLEDPDAREAFLDSLFEKGYLVGAPLARGREKFLGFCRLSPTRPVRRIDVQFARREELPFALLYMTGPREFTLALRRRARAMNMTLSEHGLVSTSSSSRRRAKLRDEGDVMRALGLTYVPPEKRSATI